MLYYILIILFFFGLFVELYKGWLISLEMKFLQNRNMVGVNTFLMCKYPMILFSALVQLLREI